MQAVRPEQDPQREFETLAVTEPREIPPADGHDPQSHAVVRRHRGLFGRTALVSSITLLSRILGFARESLSALLFGDASSIYDAFVTAWRVPNLFRRLLGEGALATSLQTAMTEADHDHGDRAGRQLFRSTMRTAAGLLVSTCVVVMAVVWFLPDRMPLTGWPWLGEDPAPVRELCVRLMPFVVLICLAALASGALQVRGHFAATMLAPVAMNFVWIVVLVAIGTSFGWSPPIGEGGEGGGGGELGELARARHLDMARVLGWGVLLAGAVSLACLVPSLLRRGLLGPLPSGGGREVDQGTAHLGALHVLRGALPLALGAAVYQINVMVDGFMAEALLREGGPTTLYYAIRIKELPMGLVAVAALSAVFPALKALGHTGDLAGVRSLHDRTHLAICFIALPATAGLVALAEPIVAVLLQHGAFGPDGVARTAGALRLLALSLVPAGAASLVARTFFALGDFRTPVRVSSAMLVSNIGLNTLFVVGLGMDVEGLALGTVLSSWLNLIVLLPRLYRRLPEASPAGPGPGSASRLIRIAFCALATGLAAAGVHALASSDPRSIPALLMAIAAGAAAFVASSTALRLPEWGSLRRRIARRFATRLDRGPRDA